MHRRWHLGILVIVLTTSSQATEIHKCEDPAGHIHYRDRPCDAPDAGREIDQSTFTVSGRGGLTDREWEEYDRIREERAERVERRIAAGRTQVGTAIGYEDRLRLRELRMRRNRILESLDRDATSVAEAVVLRQELEEIGRQEELIRDRRR